MQSLVLFLACHFPCADDELLDVNGACHADAKVVDTGVDTVDTGADTGSETGSETADTSGGDTSDTGGHDTGGFPADDGWPVRFLAPYVDATAYPTVRLGELPPLTGIHHFTLGFVVAASPTSCDASWGTYYSMDVGPSAWASGAEYFLYDEIAALREQGGDVMVSFGGAANTPIEAACTTVDDVVAQYVRVIERLDLTRIDFDVEGSWLMDPASITRRSQAIAALQAWAVVESRALRVWFTLPVLPSGLTAEGLAVVQDAIDHGVVIDGVNLMTMNYGDGTAPNPAGQMGEYGIAALESTAGQLNGVWPDGPWGHLGTTPMIGQNDVQSEAFDLEDAAQTRAYAEEHSLGMLGFWSINRDHPCPEATPWAQSNCNGSTSLADWTFARVFSGLDR